MISTTYRALFVHIPKCAGQSVEQYFLRAHDLDWSGREALCLRPNRDPDRGPPRLAHMTAAEYVRLAYLTPEQFGSYYKFAFVRNPWSRLVSEYRYRPQYFYRYDFKTFVFRKMPTPGWSDAYRHVMPQISYLTDSGGRIIVDFVGKFENLQADFAKVCEALGFGQSQLPRVNVTRNERPSIVSRTALLRLAGRLNGRRPERDPADYRDYYDDETRQYVGQMYAQDIEAFDYSFEPIAGRSPGHGAQPARRLRSA